MSNPKWDDTAATIDWDVSRKADLRLVLYITDPDNDDLPVDLSGYTFEGVIKAGPSSTLPPLKTLTVTGDAAGQLIAEIDHATFDLVRGTYVFSIWETDPAREPWFQGTFTVEDNLL